MPSQEYVDERKLFEYLKAIDEKIVAAGGTRDGTPSTDQLTRCRQYEDAGEYAKWLMERLTNEYYDLQEESPTDCLYHILAVFAIKQLANEQGESGLEHDIQPQRGDVS